MRIIGCPLSNEFETIELYALNDLHIGDPRVDLPMFHKFIAHILAAPNRFIIYAGDNMNNAIKTSVSNVYNEDMTPRQQKKFLIQELEPVKERILVLVEGNHEGRTTKDVDQRVVEDIAMALGKPDLYFEDEAYLKISFGKRGENGKRRVYTVYVVHGNGGGKRPGSALNNIELISMSTEADVYVMAHVHKKIAYKNGYRKPDLYNNNIITVERLFTIASHWSEFGGYAARKILGVSAKGNIPITLYAKEKRMDATI